MLFVLTVALQFHLKNVLFVRLLGELVLIVYKILRAEKRVFFFRVYSRVTTRPPSRVRISFESHGSDRVG